MLTGQGWCAAGQSTASVEVKALWRNQTIGETDMEMEMKMIEVEVEVTEVEVEGTEVEVEGTEIRSYVEMHSKERAHARWNVVPHLPPASWRPRHPEAPLSQGRQGWMGQLSSRAEKGLPSPTFAFCSAVAATTPGPAQSSQPVCRGLCSSPRPHCWVPSRSQPSPSRRALMVSPHVLSFQGAPPDRVTDCPALDHPELSPLGSNN